MSKKKHNHRAKAKNVTKPVETKPAQTKTAETKPVETKTVVESKVVEEPKKPEEKKSKVKQPNEKLPKEKKPKVKQPKVKQPKEKKKTSAKDWLLIAMSALALVLLIYIVYSARKTEQEISKMLYNDSQKENFTVATTVDAIEMIKISEVSSEKWIELYNSGSSDADISKAQIYVSGKKAATVEDGIKVAAGEYYVVELNANPGASKENVISFMTAEGKLIDTLLVPHLSDDLSYGLTQNENFNVGYMEATRQKANKTEVLAEQYTYVDGIGFSTPGGFYDKSFILSLATKNGDKIYYTTDGTEPTTASAEYVDGITVSSKSGSKYVYARQGFGYLGNSTFYYPNSIDAGMEIRVISVNKQGKVTGSATQEYYIGLANDSAYSNIPVLSLTAEGEDLFGYFDGIYVAGRTREDAIIKGDSNASFAANYENDWVREGKLTFFETDKGKSFEASTSISIFKDVQIVNRQKSFKFTVGDHSAFAGSDIEKYIAEDGSLILQCYVDDMELKIRDTIANELMMDSKVGTLDLSPCILFINGEYWGVYLLKAPYDARYIERHFGITDEVYFHDNAYQKEFNELYNFVTRNDMSNSDNYEQVKKLMDVDSYLEYVCANVYLGNSYFSTYTGTQWRTISSDGTGNKDGRWRWLMNCPIGNSMANSSSQTPTMDTFLQKMLRTDRFFQSLLMNKEFCQTMAGTMEKMAKERFTQDKWEPVVENAASLMRKSAVDTYVRFNGSTKDTQYNLNVDNIVEFLEERSEYITFYAKELAEQGGDLKYIDELEAQNKDKNNQTTAEGENAEAGEGTAEQAGEGQAQGGEAGEAANTLDATNDANTQDAVNNEGQDTENDG